MKKNSVLDTIWKKIKQVTIFKLMDSKIYYHLIQRVIPFIRLTTYYPSMRELTFQKLYSELRPGDIIFQIDEQKLTAKLIGGEWSHVGICVGKGSGKIEMVDMTHVGFRQTDFFKFCSESTRIAIGRVVSDRWDVDDFINSVWKQKNSEYNFRFVSKDKEDPRREFDGKLHKFNYCSQLVMVADDKEIIQANWEDLAGLGVPYVSPTGLANAKNIAIIADSDTI